MKQYFMQSFLQHISNGCAASQLQKDKVNRIFSINNMYWVCVAYGSSYNQGIHWVLLQECIHIDFYIEKTFSENQRHDLVNQGLIERGNYKGQMFKYKNQSYVFTGKKLELFPINESSVQLTLF